MNKPIPRIFLEAIKKERDRCLCLMDDLNRIDPVNDKAEFLEVCELIRESLEKIETIVLESGRTDFKRELTLV